MLFVIVLPYLGVSFYLIFEHAGMAERNVKQQATQSQFDQYVQTVAAQADPAEQISKAKQLLDSGTITKTEFDQLKQKARRSLGSWWRDRRAMRLAATRARSSASRRSSTERS